MNTDSIYAFIQELFRRGIVTIVGSGASSAVGLPTMGQLSEHLLERLSSIPLDLEPDSEANWAGIAERLGMGQGLEQALGTEALPLDLANVIASEVAQCVGDKEAPAIQSLLQDSQMPAFGRLFAHLLQNNDVADVITTNYDRLLEVAAAKAHIRMDTMFSGHTVGHLDERLSREELLLPSRIVGRSSTAQIRTRPHIRLSKPHGSLDWFDLNGEIVRSEIPISGVRQIIAPGGNKYRLGYDFPYDQHRARANKAIDGASAFLSVGYGFNDDHLQTHLALRFPNVPALLIARTLSANALDYLASNTQALGIEAAASGGATIVAGTNRFSIAQPIWILDVLLKEVLGK